MTLVRWSPFREMEAMQSEMNRLFSRLGGFNTDQLSREETRNGQTSQNQWMLPVDVIETPDALKLKAALPGVDAKDVNIELHDNLLTISAQRRREEKVETDSYHWIEQQYGSFHRSISLPRTVDTEKIGASYNDGLLELTIPKKEGSKPRRVELQTGAEPRALEAGAPSVESKQLENSGTSH